MSISSYFLYFFAFVWVRSSYETGTVAYLGGGPRCDAPSLAGPWKFFTGDFIWKGAFFAIFQQELQNSTMCDGFLRFQISKKWANLRFPLNIQKQKVFQLAMAPLCQIINTPLDRHTYFILFCQHILLCSRPNGSHYGYCTSICLSVRLRVRLSSKS